MDILLQIGLLVQFIVVLIIYFHSAAFYRSMSKMILQTLSSTSKTRTEVEFLVQVGRTINRDYNEKNIKENIISDFLKAFGYENFDIRKVDEEFLIDIYDFNGKRILTESELDYLYEDVNKTLKIAYFKSGEEHYSKMQIVPKSEYDKIMDKRKKTAFEKGKE